MAEQSRIRELEARLREQEAEIQGLRQNLDFAAKALAGVDKLHLRAREQEAEIQRLRKEVAKLFDDRIQGWQGVGAMPRGATVNTLEYLKDDVLAALQPSTPVQGATSNELLTHYDHSDLWDVNICGVTGQWSATSDVKAVTCPQCRAKLSYWVKQQIASVQGATAPCSCHSGSVCGPACAKGIHHGGCDGVPPPEGT